MILALLLFSSLSLCLPLTLFITPSSSYLTSLLPFTLYVHCRQQQQQQKFSFFYFTFFFVFSSFRMQTATGFGAKSQRWVHGADDVIPCSSVHHHSEHNYDHSEQLQTLKLWHSTAKKSTFEQHKVNATARIMLVRMQPKKGDYQIPINESSSLIHLEFNSLGLF